MTYEDGMFVRFHAVDTSSWDKPRCPICGLRLNPRFRHGNAMTFDGRMFKVVASADPHAARVQDALQCVCGSIVPHVYPQTVRRVYLLADPRDAELLIVATDEELQPVHFREP